MVPVARRNLLDEKARFAISVSGVAFAVLLILIVLSLYRGWSRTGETFEQLPGELWAVQHGTTDPFHSVSLLEPGQLDALWQVDGVAAVVPVLSRQMNFVTGEGRADSARLLALGIPPGFDVETETRDRFVPGRGQIIIDGTLSRTAGLKAGDRLTLGNITLTVGNVQPRGYEVLSPFAFAAFEDARAIFGVGDLLHFGIIVLQEGAAPESVRDRILSQHTGLDVFTTSEFAQLMRQEIEEGFLPVIMVLVFIGFVVGAAVVGLTIYTATIERTREFGVMKAVGASRGFLYRIVLSQSAILTMAGFLLGLVGAVGLAALAEQAVPEFVTEFRAADVAGVLVAAGLMALMASFVPVRRIAAIDPAMVFRA